MEDAAATPVEGQAVEGTPTSAAGQRRQRLGSAKTLRATGLTLALHPQRIK